MSIPISPRRRITLGALAGVLTQAGLGGCTPMRPPLQFSTNPWPAYDVLHVAREMGLLSQQGLRLELVSHDSLGGSRRAFERGQVDGCGATLMELLCIADTTGMCPCIGGVVDYSKGADVLVGQAGMHSPYELRNKRIAIEPGTVHLQLLALALESVQLRIQDVQLVPTPQPMMPSAFADGLVDGAACFPPESNRLVEMGGQVVFTSAQAPERIVDVLLFTPRCVENRRDELVRLMQVYFMVQEGIVHGEAGFSLEVMAEREHVSVGEIRQIMAGLHFLQRNQQAALLAPAGPVAAALDNLQSAMLALGELKQHRPLADFLPPGGLL